MKHRSAERADWQRVTQRRFNYTKVETTDFCRVVTLERGEISLALMKTESGVGATPRCQRMRDRKSRGSGLSGFG